MYANKSIKYRKDGTKCKDFFYYACKHRTMTRGHKCDYKKQINEELLDSAVAEVFADAVGFQILCYSICSNIGGGVVLEYGADCSSLFLVACMRGWSPRKPGRRHRSSYWLRPGSMNTSTEDKTNGRTFLPAL